MSSTPSGRCETFATASPVASRVIEPVAVLALCGDWQPDLLVCEETDFGSMVAAERLELPHASVLVIAAGAFARPGLVAEPLDALRAEHGLPADPELAMLGRYLVLSPFPPGYRDPAFPLPATAHFFDPLRLDPAPTDAVPPWLAGLDGAPTVYFTLGTVFNLESGDLFARVLAGLRHLPINVVATVGPHIDPEELGPLPDNIHVEQYVSQFAGPPALQRRRLPRRVGHGRRRAGARPAAGRDPDGSRSAVQRGALCRRSVSRACSTR